MKKSLPIIIILIIIVVALAGWKFLGKGKKTTTQGGTQEGQATPTQAAGESFTGKIKDAFMRNIPLECTYKTDDQNFATAHLKNKKYHAEITSNGKLSYVILVDNCFWMWEKDKTEGVKMCFEPQEGEDIWTDFEQQQQEGSTTDLDYNCAPSIVNDAVFTPPVNIKFTDVSEMIKNLGQPTGAAQ